MYNMINIINTSVCYVSKLRVEPKSSHCKKKNIFSISLILYLYEVVDVHQTYCDKSNHYAAHLKLIQCYMSIISQQNCKKKIKWISYRKKTCFTS